MWSEFYMKSSKPGPGRKARATKSAPLKDVEDWRSKTLERMRELILEADPAMVEERKWKKPSNDMKGVPVWSHDGIVCTGETYKKVVAAQNLKLE